MMDIVVKWTMRLSICVGYPLMELYRCSRRLFEVDLRAKLMKPRPLLFSSNWSGQPEEAEEAAEEAEEADEGGGGGPGD